MKKILGILGIISIMLICVLLTACIRLEKNNVEDNANEIKTEEEAEDTAVEETEKAEKSGPEKPKTVKVFPPQDEKAENEEAENEKAENEEAEKGGSAIPEAVEGTEEAEKSYLMQYEDPDKGIFVIEENEPADYLGISSLKWRRTSRDKVELKELELTFRNIEKEPVRPIVKMLFENTYSEGSLSKAEREFPLPEVRPGMKFVKIYPISVYFHELEDKKDIKLSFYKKYETPRAYLGARTVSFVPMDELDSLEIKWT